MIYSISAERVHRNLIGFGAADVDLTGMRIGKRMMDAGIFILHAHGKTERGNHGNDINFCWIGNAVLKATLELAFQESRFRKEDLAITNLIVRMLSKTETEPLL